MKKEDFYFDSRDGISRIHAVRYLPEQGEVTCVMQIVHGMAEYIERYEEFASFLTDRGIVVTGEDHLGHGKSVDADGTYGYFCSQDAATVLVRDVHRLKKLTQEIYPSVPYVILGHSMGSFILRNYMCRYGSGISGAIIAGTGMQRVGLIRLGKLVAGIQRLFCGDHHVSRLIDRLVFSSYNNRIEKPCNDFAWLSRNAENVEKYKEDSLCGFTFTVNGFRTSFELISRIQKRENLERIPKNLPVLMVSGTEDPVGEYGAGVYRACESMKAVGINDITLKLYDRDRHELLNETDRAAVMQDIYDWLKSAVIMSQLEQEIIKEIRKSEDTKAENEK